jgi:hypothetical protein
MAKRYIPAQPFHTRIDGVKRSYSPDYKEPGTGLPGYPESAVPAQLRSSFRVIEVSDPAADAAAAAVVEQMTAAPGEKRTVRRDAQVSPAPTGVKAKTPK